MTLDHLSAHVDQNDVLSYIERMRKLPAKIYINHGMPEAQRTLAQKLHERFGVEACPVSDNNRVELFLSHKSSR